MGSTPKAPSVQEQTQGSNSQNMWAAMVNNVMGNADTVSPYGSTTSRQVGSVAYKDPFTGVTTNIPRWQQTTAFSPQQQALYNKEMAGKSQFADVALKQLGNVQSKLANPIDMTKMQAWHGYTAPPTLQAADENYRKKIEGNMMESFNRSALPSYAAEDAQSAARGMGGPGSQYYYNTQNQRGDALGEASRQAYNVSGEEMRAAAEGANKVTQQGWQNTNEWANNENQLRERQVAGAQGERTNILNELLAMFGMAQATSPQAPAWQGSQVNPFDVSGAMQTKYGQDLQSASNRNSAIAGILSSFMPLAFG